MKQIVLVQQFFISISLGAKVFFYIIFKLKESIRAGASGSYTSAETCEQTSVSMHMKAVTVKGHLRRLTSFFPTLPYR